MKVTVKITQVTRYEMEKELDMTPEQLVYYHEHGELPQELDFFEEISDEHFVEHESVETELNKTLTVRQALNHCRKEAENNGLWFSTEIMRDKGYGKRVKMTYTVKGAPRLTEFYGEYLLDGSEDNKVRDILTTLTFAKRELTKG